MLSLTKLNQRLINNVINTDLTHDLKAKAFFKKNYNLNELDQIIESAKKAKAELIGTWFKAALDSGLSPTDIARHLKDIEPQKPVGRETRKKSKPKREKVVTHKVTDSRGVSVEYFGRGRKPRMLLAAMNKMGKDLDFFAVDRGIVMDTPFPQ